MISLPKDNEHIINLVKYLQDTNPTNRLVSYYAMAEYIVPFLLTKQINPEVVKTTIKDLIWKINELAIIDKPLLERIFNTVLEYKLYNAQGFNNNNPANELLMAVCFQDVLGITKFYTAEDIHAINVNFNLFKQVMAEVVEVIKAGNELINPEVKQG